MSTRIFLLRSIFNNGKIPLFVKRIKNTEYTHIDYSDDEYIYIFFKRDKEYNEYEKRKKTWAYYKNKPKPKIKYKRMIICKNNPKFLDDYIKYGRNINPNDYEKPKTKFINCPEFK